jgi:hypothetical protein
MRDENVCKKAVILHHHLSVAQLVEQLTLNQRVEGSSPSGETKWFQSLPQVSGQSKSVLM